MWPQGIHRRRGLTLIELLVTIGILMLLVVVAMPALTPSSESRRVREAARQLNVFFGAARAQAMQSGRAVGVRLERTLGLAQASAIAYQVEVPPAYAGESTSSTVRVLCVGLTDQNMSALFNVTPYNGQLDNSKIAVNDLVQFNNQTLTYTVASVNPLRVKLDIRDRKTYPWPSSGTPPAVPYKFFRQPIPTAATPLELPSVVALDLQSSGTDSSFALFQASNRDLTRTNIYDPPSSVTIMFSPSGAMDRLYYSDTSRLLRETVYLLLGRRDRIQVAQNVTTATPADQYPNWMDPTSIWMTISPLTGVTSAKENFRVLVSAGTWNATNIWTARTLARQAETMGGR
jgi:type II secretory pathway pseudopilin PulG